MASKISHAQSRAPLQEILGPPLRTTTLAKSSSSYYSGHPPNDMATGRKEEYEKFDPLAFLEMRYRKTTDYYRFSFPLQEYHSFFTKIFSGNGKALKVLDYGCGPVLMYVISAVPFASEIIMADIVPECLDEIKKWIQNDPSAFNWDSHFEYVVQKLEGKGKDVAEEREAEMRKTIKAVVHCNIFDDNPIEKGYEGPYDVVMSNLCLDGACKTIDEFKMGLRKLASLLKPGGKLTMYVDAISDDNVGKNYSYGVGDSDDMERFNFIGFSREFLTAVLEGAGFTDIYINGCDRGTLKEDKLSGNVGAWATTMPEDFLGFLFAHATKA